MKILAGSLFCLMLGGLAAGQKLDIKLDALAAQASAKHEIDLDGPLLKMALAKGAEHLAKDPKAGKKLPIGDLLSGIEAVHVREYEFEKPGAYTDTELDSLRKQVGGGSGWSRIVGVKEKNESTEVYLWLQGEQVGGCLILHAEPKEVAVVHVGGSVSLAKMKELVDSNIKYDLSSLMANVMK